MNSEIALGRDVGREIAEVLGLSDIDRIKSITIDLAADDAALVRVDRLVQVEQSKIIVRSFAKYSLRLIDQTETEEP